MTITQLIELLRGVEDQDKKVVIWSSGARKLVEINEVDDQAYHVELTQ